MTLPSATDNGHRPGRESDDDATPIEHARTRWAAYQLDLKPTEADGTWTGPCPVHRSEHNIVVEEGAGLDAPVTVNPCPGGCHPEEIMAVLGMNGHAKAPERWTRARERITQARFGSPDAANQYLRVVAALTAQGYAGRRSDLSGVRGEGRYQCPVCGAPGDGHGLKAAVGSEGQPVVLICFACRAPTEDLIGALKLTWADIARPLAVTVIPPVTVTGGARPTVTVTSETAGGQPSPGGHRTVTLTPATAIKVRPITWLWDERLPAGAVSLLGGREGIGKSTIAYTLAADVTRGSLPGAWQGTPKSVLVAATEDSWEHTIVPRLMAAGADLRRVYRVDVATGGGVSGQLSLPRDVTALAHHIADTDAALVLLDPLMSRLDAALDAHRDGEVRQALEPIAAIADRTGATFLGLIHVNKGGSSDPLTTLMASRAFVAVARSVLFVAADPDTPGRRLLGTPKSNLGRNDEGGLPTLTFTLAGQVVGQHEDGPIVASKVTWGADSDHTVRDVIEATVGDSDSRTATAEAKGWLQDYLAVNGGAADSRDIKAAGRKEGHGDRALQRAGRKLRLHVGEYGFPRKTQWSLPDALETNDPNESASRDNFPRGGVTTVATGATGQTGRPVATVATVAPVATTPRETVATGGGPDLDLYRCPVCGDPTMPSSAGHPSLCRDCTLAELADRSTVA